MFGDPVSNPKEWNLGKLGDVVFILQKMAHTLVQIIQKREFLFCLLDM